MPAWSQIAFRSHRMTAQPSSSLTAPMPFRAGGNAATDWAAVVRSIWVLHVQGNGWNDIGYNYLIDPNGVLYEGRGGGDGVMGAHFSCVNSGTMGVALLGTFSVVPAPAAALS